VERKIKKLRAGDSLEFREKRQPMDFIGAQKFSFRGIRLLFCEVRLSSLNTIKGQSQKVNQLNGQSSYSEFSPKGIRKTRIQRLLSTIGVRKEEEDVRQKLEGRAL